MKNIWTFGCSFTFGDGTLEHDEYCKRFRKSNDELPWTKILAKKLECELQNKGIPGVSNETILETIIENWDNINPGDIVIIGKTWSHRFDFPLGENTTKVRSIVYRGGEEDVAKWFNLATVGIFTPEQIETIKLFSVEFATHMAYSHRHDIRLNFIKKMLLKERKVDNCYIWDVESLWNKFELIHEATNSEIIDHHWSYKGHKDFSEYIEKKLHKII